MKALSNKRVYSAHELPAFTPWKPASLDDGATQRRTEPEPLQPEPVMHHFGPVESPPPSSEIAAETAGSEETNDDALAGLSVEQIQSISEEAWHEGYKAGLIEGRAQAEARQQTVADLLRQIESQAKQLEDELAPRVLDLAIDLARHVLRSEISIKPDHILDLVREATQSLPLPASHPKLKLHPEDAALVREQLGDELEPLGWKILQDSSLQRGDCLIETSHSEVDAKLSSRWHHLMLSLGQNKALDDDAT